MSLSAQHHPTLAPPSRRSRRCAEAEWLEAAQGGIVERLRALHARSPDLCHAHDTHGTALHRAAGRDHARAVAWLLSARVPVEARSAKGHTALHVAAYFGHHEVAALLLGAGACASALDSFRFPPLVYAAHAGSETVIRALIDAGAALDTHAYTQTARDPLSAVGVARRTAMTARGVEAQRRSAAALKLLEHAMALENRWWRAARAGDVDSLTELLGAGQRINAVCVARRGMSALLWTVKSLRVDAVTFLVARGADARHVDADGAGPLHYLASAGVSLASMACWGAGVPSWTSTGRIEPIARALLGAGTPPMGSNSRGFTPAEIIEARPPRPVSSLPPPGREEAAVCAEVDALAALLRRAGRTAALLRAWRLAGRLLVPTLRAWHARAAARVYAPGGAGFRAAEEDFEARAAKVQRTCHGRPAAADAALVSATM